MVDETLSEHDSWEGARSEGPGTRIGVYTLVRRLGEGGFGDVFEAEQEQPVKRRVALKIIKLGMDTREVMARFDVERQALAMMEHPHIARVFDAGATESGRPYFVMELVDGEPITQFCDVQQLTIRARLRLFEQVCKAVQHAHTKGVIHRDLKPGNVLTSLHEGQPYAKVIDFGIAKATSGRLTDRTLATHIDQVMGTPLYMSPEQARGSADIDTRSDIYSLGVILYELLTGSTPVERTALLAISLADTQRLICESEPPFPSARLMKLATRMSGEVNFRTIDPRKVARMIRGELDWIVMKALEKDPARRYETANALATDVQCYLAGEAVLAAPPGALYRAQKFIRRNKGAVLAGSLVAASLVVGIAGFAWQAHIARARADELEKVSKFQAEMLGQVDPTAAGKLLSDDVRAKFDAALAKAGVPAAERSAQVAAFVANWQRINATDTATDLIDRTILKPAVTAIDRQFKDQPIVDASLRQALADLYRDIGRFDDAMPLQRSALATRRRVLGDSAPRTLNSVQNMGFLLEDQEKLDMAEPYFREALAQRRRVLGENHRDTLSSLGGLGLLLEDQGKASQAEPYLREAFLRRRRAFGENDPDTLTSMGNVAGILLEQGKPGEAEQYLREALAKVRLVFGEEDPKTLALVNNLGMDLMQQGKLSEAEPYLRESLDKARRLEGEENPDTLQSNVNLGELLDTEGKLSEAEPYLREGMEKSRRVLGDDNENTLIAIMMMGRLLVDQGQHAEAEQLLAPSEDATRKTFADADPRRLGEYLITLGRARAALGKYAPAEADLLEAESLTLKASGPKDKQTRACTQALADLYAAWGKAMPGRGYEAKAAEWKKKLDGLAAASGK